MLAPNGDSVPFTAVGGLDNTFPQGRKVTQWQINDNLTWTRGQHTLHFGINTRRVDTSDYDLGEGTAPTVIFDDLAQGNVRHAHARGSIHERTAQAAAKASNSGFPSVPPISGSTRSSGCGISPSTRRFGLRIPAMARALPFGFACGVTSPVLEASS